MMEPMRNGMMEMMITFLLPAMSEMRPPIKQPRMAVKAQHEAETMFVFIWKLANMYWAQHSYKTTKSLQK